MSKNHEDISKEEKVYKSIFTKKMFLEYDDEEEVKCDDEEYDEDED